MLHGKAKKEESARQAAEAARQTAETEWKEQHDELGRVLNSARANTGYQSDHIVLKKGESETAFVNGAGLVEMRAGAGHYTGHSQGVSIPIGSIHGRSVRYRVGAQKGHFVKGAQEEKIVDQGRLVVTTQRLVFLGKLKNVECAFAKLVNIQQQAGQLVVSVSNRQKPTVIRYGSRLDGWIEMRLSLALAIFRGEAAQFAQVIEQNLRELETEKPRGMKDEASTLGAAQQPPRPTAPPEPQPPSESRQAQIAEMARPELNSEMARVVAELKVATMEMKANTARFKTASDDDERAACVVEQGRLADIITKLQGEIPPMQERARSLQSAKSPTPAPTPQATPPPPIPPPAPKATTPAPPPPGTPAGWLTDPVAKYEHRYWDGGKWTEHVSSGGEQSTDFP